MLLSGMVAYAQTDSLSADTLFYDDTVEYSAPKKNPIYYFGSPFCEHFLELRYTSGDDGLGLGAMYSYLPEVWGFNVSAFMMDYNYYWLSGGAAYRLSKPWSHFDWHLYGNAGLSYDNSAIHQLHPTLEMGIRCASADGMGQRHPGSDDQLRRDVPYFRHRIVVDHGTEFIIIFNPLTHV